MHLSKIVIKNYRLLIDAYLDVDSKTTLIVGRNNTAKTSLFECITSVLDGKSFTFNDYPLSKRDVLYSHIDSFINNEISFDQLSTQVEPISVEFFIDYSLNDNNENLGALSPFIIDVDFNTTTAKIRAEYGLISNEKLLRKLLEKSYFEDNGTTFKDDKHKSIITNFQKLFELNIYAINPNNSDDRQLKSLSELKDLFPYQIIPAERLLGEDGSHDSSLSALITEFFDMNLDDIDNDLKNEVKLLRNLMQSANETIQQKSDEILSKLVNESVGFGYPNVEELQLGVSTQLSLIEQIKKQTQLSYISNTSDSTSLNKESLPSKYNGLGYKNLIKIMFLLAAFAKKVIESSSASIPLLFIEEPESHMHPQMQQAFAKYLEDFIKKLSTVSIQSFVTSHSAHIANTIDFSKLRYAMKTKDGVLYKNLNIFSQQDQNNIEFIKKYLTLTKCDLFFADKAILVEGASERLLLPDMIEKCKAQGLFDTQKYKLTEQYYSIIEIGGAFAYKFIPFLDFLGIPCLILTDIDSVHLVKNTSHLKSCCVSRGKTTSNETIKWWYKTNKPTEILSLKKIREMEECNKTIKKCHIEFQTEEEGICGRSLEEAIINVNRELFKLKGKVCEKDITFTGKSKTDFALNLIYNHNTYKIPRYIQSGLKWLNDQKTLD